MERALTVPVTKIVGSRDGLASRDEVEQNRRLLPPWTKWIWVEGGKRSSAGMDFNRVTVVRRSLPRRNAHK